MSLFDFSKLTALKQMAAKRDEELNLSPSSGVSSPSPLHLILSLCTKAHKDCYVDHMKGTRDLIAWLSPIDLPTVPDDFTVPSMLVSYESLELAKMLCSYDQTYNLETLTTTKRAIIYTLVTDSWRGMYNERNV